MGRRKGIVVVLLNLIDSWLPEVLDGRDPIQNSLDMVHGTLELIRDRRVEVFRKVVPIKLSKVSKITLFNHFSTNHFSTLAPKIDWPSAVREFTNNLTN